jgi:hypothetical protein
MVLLNEERDKRLSTIKSLSDNGWSSRDICDYFNNNNILTPKGRPYTMKNVWTTLMKYRKRLERSCNHRVIDIKEQVTLISHNEPTFYD